MQRKIQAWFARVRERFTDRGLPNPNRFSVAIPVAATQKEKKPINWKLVIGTALGILLLVGVSIGGTILVRNRSSVKKAEFPDEYQRPVSDIISIPDKAIREPNVGEEKAIDLSAAAVDVKTSQMSVNIPGIDDNEFVYSAGEGSFDEQVLRTLYLYDVKAQTETPIAEATVDKGEIYEQLVNEKYIVWVDTDQLGTNRIFMRNREDPEGENILIKECENQKPKLRLSGATLIWVEQTEEKLDRIFIVDLESGEDLALSDLSEAASYGVSAPAIYGDIILWAAYDPDQTIEDAEKNGEKSCIYSCNLARLGDENAEKTAFDLYAPGMYVHEPVLNQDAWAWIDKNKAPDSGLFIRYGGHDMEVARGNITTYGFGDGFLMYGRNQTIWAYFYETNQYARLSAPDEKAKLPVVGGRRVAWFVESEDKKDHLKTIEVTVPKS